MNGVDVVQRGHPVPQVDDIGAALRDRQLALGALAPVVDDVRDHVDRPGQHVSLGHQPQVLPDHLLGEGQLMGIPEAAPEQLVPDRHVVEQPRRPGHVRAGLPALERQRMQRRRVEALGADPPHGAAHEVRAGPLERVQQQLVRVGRQHVVAVDEGQELPAGLLDAAVAGTARAAVFRLDQPEPRVGGRLGPGDRGAVVGGAVVDHDHFEIGERLGRDRVQAVGEVVGVIEERYDDADPGGGHWSSLARHLDWSTGACHLAAGLHGASQPSATGS